MDQTTGSAETIYVAVGTAVEESKHTLLWALQNLSPTKICILHVHQPASFNSLSRMSFITSELQRQEFQKKILDRIMDDYLLICDLNGVQATKLNIEMNDAAEGIVELIGEHNIKKLVMGAAANKHFSEGMADLKSEKAQNVELLAPPSCKIWFLCAGQLVRIRFPVETRRLSLSCASSSSSYLTRSSKMASNSDLSVSETPEESSDWLEFHEGSSEIKPFDKLDRRVKSGKDVLNAVMHQASELKSLYDGELRRRKEAEEALQKLNKELEEIKPQLKTARVQKLESDNHVKVLETDLSLVTEQLEICQRERDELQIKCANTCKQLFLEFSVAEIHDATKVFHPSFKIAEGAYWSIYKCTLRHTEVAIKVLHQHSLLGPSEFQHEVDLLSKMRHPNLVTLIGVCPEIWALIYEYLPNGSLEDRLSRRDNTPPLSWKTRIHIATEICSALIFLHSGNPQRLVHGNLKPGNILLDTNFGCKLSEFGAGHVLSSLKSLSDLADTSHILPYLDPQFFSTKTLTTSSDIYSFGIILLQLITGKPPLVLSEEVEYAVNGQYLNDILDPSAGVWTCEQVEQLTRLALRCCDTDRSRRPDLASEVYKVLERIRNSMRPLTTFHTGSDELCQPPHYFICPISQEVMTNPHMAADGYTYELHELRLWLDGGHNTSPVIGNQLAHCNLIPNHALRSAILEWRQQQQLHPCSGNPFD
ncbi:hypothetical protein V6N13_086952 [Hibiscus sabdariffa]|uniref:RING-type E3 ubiquitin transferase n=1 Tax=Hibiscus sabdariffa TaxID=183260 RepID=A0ABR2FUQ6_9ROSI